MVTWRSSRRMARAMTCLLMVLTSWTVLAAPPDNWVPIRTGDKTIYLTQGKWRVAGFGPTDSILLSQPIYAPDGTRKLVGWMEDPKCGLCAGWKFYLQDYAQRDMRNPNQPDNRQMGWVLIGSLVYAVRIDSVLLDKNNVVWGVKGECLNAKDRHWYPIQLYPVK